MSYKTLTPPSLTIRLVKMRLGSPPGKREGNCVKQATAIVTNPPIK